MAVREAHGYLFDSHQSVLGRSVAGEQLSCDYPLDQYGEGIVLSSASQVYADVLQGFVDRTGGAGKYLHEGRPRLFKGKRAFASRIGRWSDLAAAERHALYSTFDTNAEDKDMSHILRHLDIKQISGDSLACVKMLDLLSGESQLSASHRAPELAALVSNSAALFAAPASLTGQEPLYKHLDELRKAHNAIGHLVHIESRLKKTLALLGRLRANRKPLGLKAKLARAVASKLWFESDDEVSDAFLSIAMNASIAEDIDALEEKIDEYEDSGNYDASDYVEGLASRIKASAAELEKIGSTTVPIMVGNLKSCYATKDGVLLQEGRRGYVLSAKDLGSCVELVQEALSAVVDLVTSHGHNVGLQYHKAIRGVWAAAALLTPDEANFLSCAHRDYELDVKQVDIKAFDRQGKYVRIEDCNRRLSSYSPECSKLISSYMSRLPRGVSAYHWCRLMRCVPLTRFSIPAIVTEAKLAYEMTHDPEDESMAKLTQAIKLQLGLCYKARHGVSPPGFDEALEGLDANAPLSEVVDAMSGWDIRGVGNFDSGASIARDRSNIPAAKDILLSADTFNNAQPELRREILYFEKHDKDKEARDAIRYLATGCTSRVKSHVGVKPESKEGGRAVTSERSDIRKANTLVNNNLMPYVDQIGGSLLAASPAKRERAIHDMVSKGHDLDRYLSYFLATDFIKFGHSLSYKLQKTTFRVVADFFALDWIGNIPDMLLKQDVVCVHKSHHTSFPNTTGGDGQGMRNAVWQLMLAGCLVFVNSELAGQVNNLRGDKPLDLLYFMDDHLFRLLVKHDTQVASRVGITRELSVKLNSIEDAICSAYRKVGLGTNEEKNTRSLHGAILTGMQISTRGRESVPGRAIQRAFVETSHRAPSLVDIIANVASASSSAMEDGRDRVSTLAASIYMSSLKVVLTLPSACKRNPKIIGIALMMPVNGGGLGHPHESSWVVNAGVNVHDDALFCLYSHCSNKTALSQDSLRMLNTVARSKRKALADCGSVFTFKHNTVLEAPSSTIHSYLRKSTLGSMYSKLDGLAAHKTSCLNYLSGCYTQLPGTVARAMVDCHMHSVMVASVDRVATSATATILLGPTLLSKAKRGSTMRSMTYLAKLSRLTATGSSAIVTGSWAEFTAKYGQAVENFWVETPPRGPRYGLVMPATAPPGDLEAHHIPENSAYGILEPGQGGATTSRGEDLWTSMERSAVNTAVDLLVVSNSSPGAGHVATVLDAMYGLTNLTQLAALEKVSDPFRSVKSVQFAAQTSGYGVRNELKKCYVTAESTIEVRRNLETETRGHVNYAAAIAVALCATGLCRNFQITTLATWTEPTFVSHQPTTRKPVRSAVGPKVAVSMVDSLADVATSTVGEMFTDFEQDALEIFRYVQSSSRLHDRLANTVAALPSAPPRVLTQHLDPVAASIATAPVAKQADAVLKILAIQVLNRACTLDLGDKCLALVASAQKQLTYYSGEDPDMAAAAALLAPTHRECTEAFDVCKRAGMLQPMMHTLDRYYRAAKHAEMKYTTTASPLAFKEFANAAYKTWHRILHSCIGELCAMDIPYADTTNYYPVARYWSARHKRHYAHTAELARLAKANTGAVPETVLSELITYELKAKVLDSLATDSKSGVSAEQAMHRAFSTMFNVYARSCAKHLNRAYPTITAMRSALRRGNFRNIATAWDHTTGKVYKTILMISKDVLGASGNIKPNNIHNWVAAKIGTHSISGIDRTWAESGEATTGDWIRDYKVKSAFGSSLEPLVDYAYLAHAELAAATAFEESTTSSISLKRRTKVRHVDGASVHSRSSYGSETMPGRRHGRDMLPDPSDMSVSPLTIPSNVSRGSADAAPIAPPLETIVSGVVDEQLAAIRPQVGRRSRAQKATRSQAQNLADLHDWND